MKTKLADVWCIDIERLGDERGFFARTYCEKEFFKQGIETKLVQDSVGFNVSKGTLRGMHFHAAPYRQTRLVRCSLGSAHVVVLDLRPGSDSFLSHYSVELSADNHRAIYVPTGLALGYQTLEADTEIYYQMSNFYDPDYERGFRWNDPAFNLDWPVAEKIIKDRDNEYPDFNEASVIGLN